MRRCSQFALLPLASLLLVACSASDPAPVTPGNDSGTFDATRDGALDATSDAVATQSYAVEYVAVGDGLHVGKSLFQLKITHMADGTPATGLASSVKLAPKMKMSMMSHGNPVPADAVKESSTPGTYDCTLFFTMASVDGDGNAQGQWTLKVDLGAFDAGTLDLMVKPATSTDTPSATLRRSSDMIASMGGAKMRSYPLFRDTLEAGSGDHTFKVFLATVQEGGMVWPPVTAGLKLMDQGGIVEQLTVQTVELQASTDASTWVPMPCDAMARCTATVAGLSKGVASKIFVKMKLNGNDYTTDGNALDPSKNVASFAVTPP